jgi:hypothetical protein
MQKIDNQVYIAYIVIMTTTLKHIKFDEEDLQAVRLAARLAARHARTEIALPSLSKHTTARKPQSVLGIIQLPPEIDPDEMDKAIHAAAQRANARSDDCRGCPQDVSALNHR